MSENVEDDYVPSAGMNHALGGIALLVVGSWMVANLDEDPVVFGSLATVLLGSGLYCLVVGAVARGLQLAGGR